MKINLTGSKAIVLFLAALFCISSCSKKNEVSGSTQTSGYVTFINASPSLVTQDFFVDNIKVNSQALAYTQSTGYLEIKAAGHQLQVKSSANSTLNNTSTFSVTAPFYYSIFYAEDKSVLELEDERTPPKTGQCRVRFINLSSIIGTVDIGTVGIGIAKGIKFLNGLEYRTYTKYYDFNAGTAFTLYTGGSNVILKDILVTLEAGHFYTIYLTGTSSSGVKAQLLTLD
jgi:hypothetical protein